MKVKQTLVPEETPCHIGDVLEIKTGLANIPTDYVLIAQIKGGIYALISITEGNRFYESVSVEECEKLQELQKHNEGLYPSEIMEIFTSRHALVRQVHAELHID